MNWKQIVLNIVLCIVGVIMYNIIAGEPAPIWACGLYGVCVGVLSWVVFPDKYN